MFDPPMSDEAPMMYKIEIEGKPYTENVKKFAVSKDLVLAALVTETNQILVYRLMDKGQDGKWCFIDEKKF